MNRALAGAAFAALLGVAAWQTAEALQTENAAAPVSTQAGPEPEQAAEPGDDAAPAEVTDITDSPKGMTRGPARPSKSAETPMAQRVAVVGLLNKRNGLWRDLTLKPGQALRVGDVIVRVRACEKTAPWEAEKLTGAFVQLDVQGTDQKWRRVFSGWLYNESPSLNLVQHPIYDVWTKSCTMTFPDIGSDTVSVPGGSRGGANRSSAPKSAVTPTPAPTPTERAPSNIVT